MKKFTLTCLAFAIHFSINAATFRNYVSHSLSGNTYTIWVNSDTQPGEAVIGQICNNGGNPFTGFIEGIFNNTTVAGANWRVVITIDGSYTTPRLELANKNQTGDFYGYTGCNIIMSTVLANELTTFKASKQSNQIVLDWLTASEQNNESFSIERSRDGKDFTSIASIKGAKNSTASKIYSFSDASPMKGINYYRLKSVETAGKESFSKVISVNFSGSNQKILISPNPVSISNLRVDYEAISDESVLVSIKDITGRVILNEKHAVLSGSNMLNINVGALASGYYFIGVNDIVQKFVKN